jgi:hypothetical protein
VRDHTYVHDDVFASCVYQMPTANDRDSCGLGQSLSQILQDSFFVCWQILVAILALTAVGVVFYIVSNRNANELANRNANLAVASQAQPTTIVQQPAPAQQPPVMIQQPAPVQPAPVIIQQPNPRVRASDDANMQELLQRG